jgi:hypothetical protein
VVLQVMTTVIWVTGIDLHIMGKSTKLVPAPLIRLLGVQ